MGWMERLFGHSGHSPAEAEHYTQLVERMGPGLDGDYDRELREKAGLRQPPPPPEYMGLEGEYDTDGLAKRVALALDRDPRLSDLPSLSLAQEGSTVVFRGTVADGELLTYLTEVAGRVDGSKAIDTSQVQIQPHPLPAENPLH